MSMGLTNISAEKVINNFSEKTLKLIIKVLGEEKEASKIVKNIIKSHEGTIRYVSKKGKGTTFIIALPRS